MVMQIRLLAANDDPLEISRIYEQSWKYAYKGIIPQEFLDSIPQGKWVYSLDTQGREHFVCVLDGKLIGTASISASRWESHKDCGEIISIYLLPEFVGKGIGRALFERCVRELESRGFERIILWVLEENRTARHFYERAGFICTGEYRNDEIGGKPLREVLYGLDVRGKK